MFVLLYVSLNLIESLDDLLFSHSTHFKVFNTIQFMDHIRLPFDLHDHPEKTQIRYVLGQSGKSEIAILALNPSSANSLQLDHTLRRISSITNRASYEGFTLFNLYPQRTTQPSQLHHHRDSELHKTNLNWITSQFTKSNFKSIWAAWGNEIESRSWLMDSLSQITREMQSLNPHWLRYGSFTNLGHPRHPSRASDKLSFEPFDIRAYLNCHTR